MAEELILRQRGSEFKDYFNILNPSAVNYNNPTLEYNSRTDVQGGLDTEEVEFKSYFDGANMETKRAMLGANNNSDAIKVAQRRDIFEDSAKAVAEDGLATQLTMGVIPAVMSPSSLLPAGAIFKAAQVAKTTSKLQNVRNFAVAGAGIGVVANVADEALFDLQGMPTNYLGAAGIGAMFGGFLGGLGGALVGPRKFDVAQAIDPKNDTFSQDFMNDPHVKLEYDENGIPLLQDIGTMDKTLLDRMPWLGDKLRSDVHTVYQDGSDLLRGFMGRLASPTVSMKDSQGNLVAFKKTAKDLERESKGTYNILRVESTNAHREARANGYEGDIEVFNEDVWKVYVDAMNRQKNDAASFANQKTAGMKTQNLTTAERNELFKSNREAINEFYDKREFNFKGSPETVKGAEAYQKYFEKSLKKSQDMGIKQLVGINSNRLYAPRVYNYKGIHKGDVTQETLQAEVRAGLQNDVRNGNMTADELNAATASITQKLNESAFDLNNLTNSFMVKDLPFATHLKSVKLYLNEAHMPKSLNSNFDDITGAYHRQMTGRQGVQYAFGTDQLSEVQQLVRDEHLAQGKIYDPKTQQAFERTVQDILGTLRMNTLADTPAWTFTRNLTSYNSLRLGGGFGGNQMIELAASIMMGGVQALMSGRMLKSLKNTTDLLYTHKGQHDEFAQYLVASGHMETTLHTSRINRYADTETGFNSGFLENKLNWMNDKLMKYNGMRYFMGVMEDYSGGAVVTQLKQGKVPAARLSRWGLTVDEGKALGKSLKEVTKGDKWDLSKLSQQEADSLQLAIGRGIEEVVVQGDSIHLPSWMKAPGPFTKVLTQFMRFPMIAQETLLRKGMADEQAQMVGGVLASVAAYVSGKYLREQASISLGSTHPVDAKYDYDNYTDEDWLRVVGESLNYTAPLGMLSAGFNYGAIATGQNELGREWQSKNGMMSLLGPSGGLGEDLIQIIRAGVNGEITDERTFQRFKHLGPALNLPLINEGANTLVEKFGD